MKKIILYVLLCCFGLSVSAENTLEIVKLSPQEQTEYISSFAKFKFKADSIFVYDFSNQLVSQNALANVHVLLFTDDQDITSDIDNVQEGKPVLKVFPNPATYQIKVENYEPIQAMRIYSSNGQIMMTASAQNETTATIDLSSLAEGSYLLLVNQTIVKFIKK